MLAGVPGTVGAGDSGYRGRIQTKERRGRTVHGSLKYSGGQSPQNLSMAEIPRLEIRRQFPHWAQGAGQLCSRSSHFLPKFWNEASHWFSSAAADTPN